MDCKESNARFAAFSNNMALELLLLLLLLLLLFSEFLPAEINKHKSVAHSNASPPAENTEGSIPTRVTRCDATDSLPPLSVLPSSSPPPPPSPIPLVNLRTSLTPGMSLPYGILPTPPSPPPLPPLSSLVAARCMRIVAAGEALDSINDNALRMSLNNGCACCVLCFSARDDEDDDDVTDDCRNDVSGGSFPSFFKKQALIKTGTILGQMSLLNRDRKKSDAKASDVITRTTSNAAACIKSVNDDVADVDE